MPKLKKHSEIQKQDDSYFQDTTNDNEEDASENFSLKGNLIKPKKMKMRQRVKMFDKDHQNEQQKKTQKRYNQLKEESNQHKDNSQEDIFLNKYTDDDIDTIEDKSCPPQKQKKMKKNEIKTRNKMFSAFEIEESKQTKQFFPPQQPEECQLQVIKKQKRQSACLLQKVDQKVINFKKKLEYKDLNKDHKYKNDIKNKLKSIEEAEEINISVEVPKVFGGKHAHLEAAIYLRNKKELSTQQKVDSSRQSEGEEESVMHKDRKQYYQQLGKQVKLKKAETMTENILKECFKKSQLQDQDLDFLPDLEFNGDRRESVGQKDEVSNHQKLDFKGKINKSGSFSDGNLSNKNQLQQQNKKQQDRLNKSIIEIPQIIKQKQQTKVQDHHPQNVQQPKALDSVTTINDDKKIVKEKNKKQKNHKKPALKKSFEFSKYVELEADISDDQQEGGPKHRDYGDEESNDQQETQISSLIDDSVDVDSRDRGVVHRKFLQDMLQQEQKQYNQMRQKMEKRYLEQQENLKKRMRQAARRNKQKEQKQDSLFLEPAPHESEDSRSKSKEEQIALKNQAKLKELEQRLHLTKKQTKEPLPKADIVGMSKLVQIETAVLINNTGPIKKAVRKGLQHLIKGKSKSKPKK